MIQPLILLIKIYQKIFSPLIKYIFGFRSICRFSPSCSEYTKDSIKRFGIIKGTTLSISRLLQCQPFTA